MRLRYLCLLILIGFYSSAAGRKRTLCDRLPVATLPAELKPMYGKFFKSLGFSIPRGGIKLKKNPPMTLDELYKDIDGIFEQSISIYSKETQAVVRKAYYDGEVQTLVEPSIDTLMAVVQESSGTYSLPGANSDSTHGESNSSDIDTLWKARLNTMAGGILPLVSDKGTIRPILILRKFVADVPSLKKLVLLHELAVHYAHYLTAVEEFGVEKIFNAEFLDRFKDFSEMSAHALDWYAIQGLPEALVKDDILKHTRLLSTNRSQAINFHRTTFTSSLANHLQSTQGDYKIDMEKFSPFAFLEFLETIDPQMTSLGYSLSHDVPRAKELRPKLIYGS